MRRTTSTRCSRTPTSSIRSITLHDGKQVTLTYGQYNALLQTNRHQPDRAAAFQAFHGTFAANANTYAAVYNGVLQRDWFIAQARQFKSTLEAALHGNDIPPAVVENLVATAKAGTEPLRRYHRLRKRVLGLETYHAYDQLVPLIDCDRKYEYSNVLDEIVESMKPLGSDYQQNVRQAFEGRWIDVYENPGKRSGAYSAPVYGVHPYMLLNYNDTLDSVFTLAHEMGHSMHTMLSEAHQPFVYSDYTIFVAEVPSTLSEMLFFDHMLSRTTDQRERIVLLQHAIDDIVGTFYRQCLFADYELQAHRLAEQGEPITAEALSRVYFDLFKAYHGDAMTYDDVGADYVGARAAFLRQSVLRLSIRDLLCVVRAADSDDHVGQRRRAAGRRRAVPRAVARRRQRLSDEPAEARGRRSEHAGAGRGGREASRQARHATRSRKSSVCRLVEPLDL